MPCCATLRMHCTPLPHRPEYTTTPAPPDINNAVHRNTRPVGHDLVPSSTHGGTPTDWHDHTHVLPHTFHKQVPPAVLVAACTATHACMQQTPGMAWHITHKHGKQRYLHAKQDHLRQQAQSTTAVMMGGPARASACIRATGCCLRRRVPAQLVQRLCT